MAAEAAAAACTPCGCVRTCLVLVLALRLFTAKSLRMEIPVKTQTVNDSIIIICNIPDFLHVDTNSSCPNSSSFLEEAKVKKDNDSQYLLCKASGPYPKYINITWCESRQENSQCLNISVGATTNPLIEKEDKTLNVTVKQKHSPEHNVTYRCRVEHRPWCTCWYCDITLPENGSEAKDDPWRPVGIIAVWIIAVCVAVVLVVVSIVAVVLCKRNCCCKQTMRIFIEEETPKAFIHSLALDSQVV